MRGVYRRSVHDHDAKGSNPNCPQYRCWEHAHELRIALNRTRLLLLEDANLLADISHVPR